MGNTPMHFAVSLNSLPMVKMLDDFGADATVKNNKD
jgi:ankyrin repeat protein